MSEALKTTYKGELISKDFNHLPTPMRMPAAELKYAEAVAMYATTDLTIRCVAEKCGVTAAGLSAHIGKRHRDLLFVRYGLDPNKCNLQTVKIKPPKGQSLMTHHKYKEAIEACGDLAYIEYNVSQIARLFNLNGTGLAAQLRVYYPDIIPNREKLRMRLGLADNTPRGPRQMSIDTYTDALIMYRDTDMTIPEVAEKCNVSKSGFCQYMRFYHKDIIAYKSERRQISRLEVGTRRLGRLSGNGRLYGPKQETEIKYATALKMFRETSLTMREIAERTGVPEAGFMSYLHQWHRDEKLRRNGQKLEDESEQDSRRPKRSLKSTAAKYAPAITSLKERPRAVAQVAADFGLNPEVFREYLKKHEPEIVARQGMTRCANGKLVKQSSSEKYAGAIHEYATSAESLKSIAKRYGIPYNSLYAYVARNCPEERESHQRILETSETKQFKHSI